MPAESTTGYSIETRFGLREFRLQAGNIAEVAADLLLVSANAGTEKPIGAAIHALERRLGWQTPQWRHILRFDQQGRFALAANEARERPSWCYVAPPKSQNSRSVALNLAERPWSA